MLELIVVDDAREDLILAERVLRTECRLGNPVTLCKSGTDAIALIDLKKRTGLPFLLFVDLVMTPVSGIEVLSHWKRLNCASNSIAVMVSGLTDIKAIHMGYQHGATTFVLKPLNKNEVLQLLAGLSKDVLIQELSGGCLLHWRSRSVGAPQLRSGDQGSQGAASTFA